MANVKFEVVRFALSTAASGTQDVTITDFGTPSAVIFFTSEAVTDDTIRSNARFSVGAIDGTRQWINGVASADAVTTTDSNLRQQVDGCVGLLTVSGGGSFDCLFSGALITDGVRLTISTQAAQEYLVTAIFIGGTDVTNAYVNYKDDLSNGTGTVAITDPGFTPDLIAASVTNFTSATGGTQDSCLAFGMALNDGSQTQRGTIIYGQDAVTTSATSGYISNTYIVGENTATALVYGTSVTSFDANGFTVQSSAAPGRSILFYVALEFANSPDLALVDMSWPTGTDYAETGIGFLPDFGLISSLVGPTARDTIDAANGVSFSLAAFDANNIYTTNYTDDDAKTGTNAMAAKSLSSDQLRILDPDGSTNSVVASAYAFDADGWDFTLSTNPASTVLGWAFAFGDGVGGGSSVSVTPGTESLTVTGYAPSVTVSDNQTVAPGTGSLALTGYAPTVNLSWSQTVPAGSATFTGYAPTVSISSSLVIDVPAGATAFTGYAPTVNLAWAQTIPAGAAAFTGYAPSIAVSDSKTVEPGVGALTVTGYTPAVTVGDQIVIQVPNGAIDVTGYAPTIQLQWQQTIPTGAISLGGYAPTVTITNSISVEIPQGTVTFTGYAPVVTALQGAGVQIPLGAIQITGYAPQASVTNNILTEIPVGSLQITSFAPSFVATNAVAIEIPIGAIQFTGYAPTAGEAIPIVGNLAGEIVVYPLYSGTITNY